MADAGQHASVPTDGEALKDNHPQGGKLEPIAMRMNSRTRARKRRRERTGADKPNEADERARRARQAARAAFDGKLSLDRPHRALQPWAVTAAILWGER
jgi:hypothetical protein